MAIYTDVMTPLVGFSRSKNRALQEVFRRADVIAPTACTVLITGETGTGKEFLAQRIWGNSLRNKKAFFPVNCAAIPESLADSQLFGHKRGSFTGANADMLGTFRSADGCTLFLDEIGELSPVLQPKLLRVLQDKKVTPVGEYLPRSVDVRIIAATNRRLREEVRTGRFREDLFHRLRTACLHLPPLRERLEDFDDLVNFFSAKLSFQYERPAITFDSGVLRSWRGYRWSGNLRQLSQAIEQIYLFNSLPNLSDEDGEECASSQEERKLPQKEVGLPTYKLADLRELAIKKALEQTQGHKGRAARLLGVHANTVTRLLAGRTNGEGN